MNKEKRKEIKDFMKKLNERKNGIEYIIKECKKLK
jgi:hypothetical protein